MKLHSKQLSSKTRKQLRRAAHRTPMSQLEDRRLFAVVATFSANVLSVFGDNLNNNVTVSRNAAGNLLVNGGAVAVQGGTPTVANTSLIQVFGQGGNDTITLDESNGALPRANLFGGTGNDTLTGGSGADLLFGQAGNDVLLGKGGVDGLFGGTENDVITGGDADDQAFGEAGDDRLVWNPGDDTDLNEGGAGSDTVEVNGGNGTEQFTVTANGTRVRFDRLNPAPFSIDIGTSEKLVVNMNGGDDSFSATGNLASLISVTADGGIGNDTILGTNGVDLLLGGDGDDLIDGQQGNDVALMGSGNDTFQWDPGDGSDLVEGQAGVDRMLFNGSAGSELFDVSANGSRVLFTRNLGNIVMDLNAVEAIDLNTLGGTDTTTVNSLAGTGMTAVNVNLSGVIGSNVGDAAADVVIVNGTTGNDVIDIFGAGASVAVVGLGTLINLSGSEGANDGLVVNALGGNDGITATTLPAGVIKLTQDGGAGNDVLLGSQGADVQLGGAGDDFVFGDNGNDVALMGAGNDTFQWDPGDGSDTVEGQADADLMLFFGSNASENVNVVANGGRVLFTRDIANITMDLDDVERVEFRALGGSDNVTVGDLTGTDLARLDVDLRSPNASAIVQTGPIAPTKSAVPTSATLNGLTGTIGEAQEETPVALSAQGDGAADTVTVNATNGADVFGATGDAGGVAVFGLQTRVNVFNADATIDRLTLNAQGGDDFVDASSLEAGAIQLSMNGGLGNDVFLGSEGDDLINGGDGNDVALMGAGDDTFVWNPGDDNDVIEGQAGFDTMLFNGANIAETISISANGGRTLFFRNIANVTMDLNDTEAVTFNALGGADVITVNDLAGTDVTDVNLNLGASDGAADNVIVNGTNDDDVIVAVGDASGTSVFGLFSQVNVTGTEAANDRLTLNALNGDDVIEASDLAAGAIQLTANGGDGSDVIVGGSGNDVLTGGAGDDVLIGGPGTDVLDGGTGDNVVIQ